ncbi:MAG: DUF2062 domain-containing protein [Gammaproteobacteria bacterium]
MRWFGTLLHDPDLWHLNRHSVAGGIATGLFCAFIPLPIHMIVAAAAAILFRVNLPLAVILTWITNPFTFAPIFLFAYTVGSVVLQEPMHTFTVEYSFRWLREIFVYIWRPLLLGCFILAVLSSLTGYSVTRLLWRILLVRKWTQRKTRRTRKHR